MKQNMKKVFEFGFWALVIFIFVNVFIVMPITGNIVMNHDINERFCLTGDLDACKDYNSLHTSKVYFFARDYMSFLDSPIIKDKKVK